MYKIPRTVIYRGPRIFGSVRLGTVFFLVRTRILIYQPVWARFVPKIKTGTLT